jgi:hypothetical protein
MEMVKDFFKNCFKKAEITEGVVLLVDESGN